MADLYILRVDISHGTQDSLEILYDESPSVQMKLKIPSGFTQLEFVISDRDP
jgi:hypothetical protein